MVDEICAWYDDCQCTLDDINYRLYADFASMFVSIQSERVSKMNCFTRLRESHVFQRGEKMLQQSNVRNNTPLNL